MSHRQYNVIMRAMKMRKTEPGQRGDGAGEEEEMRLRWFRVKHFDIWA